MRPRLASLLLLLAAAAPAPVAAAQQDQTVRAGPIRLQNASAEQAFAAVGEAFGCAFQPDDDQWQGDDLDLSLTLPAGDFWQIAGRVGQITGYEPVFTPYEAGPAPAITLRRVDVLAEETPNWGAVAGPLLIRADRAFFNIDLATARRRLVPLQVTIDLQVFATPTDPPLAVTATAARGADIDGRRLAKAGAYDSTTSIVGGIGTLQAFFDTPGGIPGGIARVDALLRIIYADEADRFTITPEQLTARPDEGDQAQDGGPTTRPGDPRDIRRLDWDGFLGQVDGFTSNGEGDQITIGLRFVRGEKEPVQWRAFYAALQGVTPSLTNGWQERGKLIVASGGEAVRGRVRGGVGLAREYVVLLLAGHERARADLPTVTLELPTRFRESRARATLELRLPIEPGKVPATQPATRPTTQPTTQPVPGGPFGPAGAEPSSRMGGRSAAKEARAEVARALGLKNASVADVTAWNCGRDEA